MATPKNPPPGETPTSPKQYEEHFVFTAPKTTDIGRRMRARFWLSLIADEIGERAALRLFSEVARQRMGRTQKLQFRYNELISQLDPDNPSPYALACKIMQDRRGDDATPEEIDALRKKIERAIKYRDKAVAGGFWDPPTITGALMYSQAPIGRDD